MKLNRIIARKEHWNEQSIQERADILSAQAAIVWLVPQVKDGILEEYKPKSEKTEYSIENHPHLLSEPLNSIFNEFRKQVLALDPCVTEIFLKLYVAYKAETNFVDVIPLAKQLRLILNTTILEIDDPKGLCRDISGLGCWGNGDVEVMLATVEEIPYVMGLVRQAFEKQMGQETNN